MPRLIAFIDASVYAGSVCDHAAWVARRMSADLDVLHLLGHREMATSGANLSGALDADARDHLMAELSALDEQRAKWPRSAGGSFCKAPSRGWTRRAFHP